MCTIHRLRSRQQRGLSALGTSRPCCQGGTRNGGCPAAPTIPTSGLQQMPPPCATTWPRWPRWPPPRPSSWHTTGARAARPQGRARLWQPRPALCTARRACATLCLPAPSVALVALPTPLRICLNLVHIAPPFPASLQLADARLPWLAGPGGRLRLLLLSCTGPEVLTRSMAPGQAACACGLPLWAVLCWWCGGRGAGGHCPRHIAGALARRPRPYRP